MADFDPDAYLASRAPSGPQGFDPDAYLAQQGAPAKAPITASGLAAAGATGIANAGIGFTGMGGDARNLEELAVNRIAQLAGASPDRADAISRGYGNVMSVVPGRAGATSDQIKSFLTQAGVPFHKAANGLEDIVQTAGEFAPALLGGEGPIAARAIKQVAVPALTSSLAGQATEGTAAEPYARLAGGLAGAGASSAVDAMQAARAAKAAAPSIADVKAASARGYQDPAVAAVKLDPAAVDQVADNAINGLKRSRLNDRLAPQTHAILDDLRNPANGATHSLEDFETTRQLLGDLAGNFNNPVEQKAAKQAISFLDTYRGAIPKSHVLAGDADLANQIVTDARANYASASTAQRVQDKINNADLRAGSTYSGGNLNNATRQNLRGLLTSKGQRRGLTQDELQSIEDTVRGSTAGNVLRAGGKLLGGGGGLGAMATGAAGAHFAGPLGVMAPALGFGVKKLGDAVTRSNADKIVSQILSRSPQAMQQLATAPPSTPALAFWKRMLLASPSAIPLQQQFAASNQQ